MIRRRILIATVFLWPLLNFSQTVTIHYTHAPVNTFLPATTLGVGYDGHEKGDNDRILRNLPQMFSVNMEPLTYRLRTELGMEVWHWNPKGSWSEAPKQQGYWTSSSDTSSFVSLSYGYRLPRRGNTDDQANNDGYSRIDDGDTNSFWKSNPYLDKYFTKQSSTKHAQWMIIDLGEEKDVNAIRIFWGNPFATAYTVDYAVPGVYDYFDNAGYFEIDSPQVWKAFSNHVIQNKNGNSNIVRLSDTLMKVRFIRIRMTESSQTSQRASTDVRDKLGFAIREIYVGKIEKKGKLMDYVQHSKSNKRQSKVYVSSNDPWHRAVDIDNLTEQLGIDRLYKIGLNRNMPVLLSAGLLYDTPENVSALVDYVTKKKFLVDGLELGEEPDGQQVSPEDAAELYDQFAKKIKQQHPHLSIGGPSLQGIILNQEQEMLPTKQWMERYVNYIHQHSKEKLYNFFSFEWYPFDSVCASSAPQLLYMPSKLQKAVSDMREIKELKELPFYMTEYGYSAFSGINEVAIQGALMNADIVGKFLSLGGNRAYLYGWEPNSLESDFECAAGNNMLFGMNDEGKVMYKTATYYGANLIAEHWAQPSNKTLEVYPASSDLLDKNGQQIVTAYALRNPENGWWSLLLINKDPLQTHKVKIAVDDEKNNHLFSLKFPVQCYQYSGKQYQWKTDGLKGYPIKDLPPEEKTIKQNEIELPPYSITVVKERE